jgi:acetate kinase
LPCILAINGGSSSIRFAVYEAGETAHRRLAGKIDRIGQSGTNMTVDEVVGKPRTPTLLTAANHHAAVSFLLNWLELHPVFRSVKAVGHRVVQGMKHSEPELVTPRLLAE